MNSDYFLDGSEVESACRYVNHSLTPNCEFKLLHPPLDQRPKLILKSIRLVEPDEELTVNYSQYSIVSLCN